MNESNENTNSDQPEVFTDVESLALAVKPGDLIPTGIALVGTGWQMAEAVAGPVFGGMASCEALFRGLAMMPSDVSANIARMAVLASAAAADEDVPEEGRTPSGIARAMVESFEAVEGRVEFENMREALRDVKEEIESIKQSAGEIADLEAAFNAPDAPEPDVPEAD